MAGVLDQEYVVYDLLKEEAQATKKGSTDSFLSI